MNTPDGATAEARGSWADWLEGLRRWRAANRAGMTAVAAAALTPFAISVVLQSGPDLPYRTRSAILIATTCGLVGWLLAKTLVRQWKAHSPLRGIPAETGERPTVGRANVALVAAWFIALAEVALVVACRMEGVLARNEARLVVAIWLLPASAMFLHGAGSSVLLECVRRVWEDGGGDPALVSVRRVRMLCHLQTWPFVGAMVGMPVMCLLDLEWAKRIAFVALALAAAALVVGMRMTEGVLRRVLESAGATEELLSDPQVPAYRVGGEGAKPANPDGEGMKS